MAPDGGQLGVCRFQDNSLIEEMTFWRQAKLQDSAVATDKFLVGSWHAGQGEAASWANENGQNLGGTPAVYHEYLRPTSSIVLCSFADSSSIETWTLLAGPECYPHLAGLVKPAS